MRLKQLILLLVLAGAAADLQAQNSTIDSARNIALNFFKTYDSIPYLTFDVKYSYYTDTLYGDFKYETMNGTYTMSGRNARYTLGDVEFLQNDSMVVAVYNRDEQIIVSNAPPRLNGGSYVPMRETLDSLLQAYNTHYSLWVKSTISGSSTSDSLGYIRLVRLAGDTQAVYNRYLIEYDILLNMITRVEFEYTEPGQELTSVDEPNEGQRLLKNSSRRKTLRIDFTNYRFDNFSDSVYSENNFVWQEDGEWKPVEKYRSYTVYSTRN